MSSTGQGGTTGAGYDQGQRRAGVPEQTTVYEEQGYQRASYADDSGSMAARGFTVLAATLMIMSGLWSFFVGITGILRGTFYVTVPNYTFSLSAHGWGWTHLILGAVVFAAGSCLFLGMTWARVVGVCLAVISAIANFLFLPYYPLWSILVITLDVVIIWALCTSGGRRRAA
jgi:hypothetical protein